MMQLVILVLSFLLVLPLVSGSAAARPRVEHHLRTRADHAARLRAPQHKRFARVRRRFHPVRATHRRTAAVARRVAPRRRGRTIYVRSNVWNKLERAALDRRDDRTRRGYDRRRPVKRVGAAPIAPADRLADLSRMIARHAQMDGVPETLVRRVVLRESGGNPRAVSSAGALGLMQIKLATARQMGYAGPPSGLFDAETNLTYAVRYLAGAYRVAGGNADRAVADYAHGYAAKRWRVSH